MESISTDAWVLPSAARQPSRAELVRERFSFAPLAADEVLVAPLFGCLEGNMLHALQRDPIDICQVRREDAVVLGNAGVVAVQRTGSNVTRFSEGDVCLLFANGVPDDAGYPIKIMGYDAPGTMGVLAKSMKLQERQLIRIPPASPYSLEQWAAFSLRYVSAWANWRVAYACWKSQRAETPPAETIVCAWGGGVSFAQVALAQRIGCRVMMIASGRERLQLLERSGIEAIERGDPDDAAFEEHMLAELTRRTAGRGVSIFIDNIGSPVQQITLKALAREGVMTTCGWKRGMRAHIARAIECLSRHIHVHTHFANMQEALDAVEFAEQQGWMPPQPERIWTWEQIPQMFSDYAQGKIRTYFPVFSVNSPAQIGLLR